MTALRGPRLGLGCASLGSRVSRRDGLAALGRAFDAGVDWYDVAPSYGDGAAEELLGAFAKGRRDAIAICTKAGILPGRASLPKRILKPAVRVALAAAPALRRAVKARRPAAAKQPLTGALVAASIDASLARLGTDRVDVLALHDATPAETARDDVLRALDDARAAGKALRIGIASSVAAAEAGLAASPLYEFVQFANNPAEPGLAIFAPPRAATIATHSVFGTGDLAAALAARIARDPALATALGRAGFEGDARAQALAFLPAYAFAGNRDGIVLLSMFARRHLDANLAAHAARRDPAAVARIAASLAPL